jgi:hypothetical protein
MVNSGNPDKDKEETPCEEKEFDIIKGHLIDEHNLSEDVALQLMSILDEETRADIMEYTAAIRADAAPKGKTVKMTADGKEPIGDRLLKGIGKTVGGLLNRINPNALKSKTVEPRKPLIMIRKEEKQLSMADTFLSIANAPKEDTEQLDEFLGPQAAKNVDALLKRGQKVLDRMGVPINRTPRGTATKADQDKKIEKNVK